MLYRIKWILRSWQWPLRIYRRLKRVQKENKLLARIWLWLRWWSHFRHNPLDVVEIETDARCNRSCSYCPVAKHKREGQMPESLFYAIVDQLQQMNFSGRFSFHFYNEPLLDPRLDTFIRYTRDRLAKATLVLVTNGDHLSRERFDQLLAAGIDLVSVSLHDKKIAKTSNALRGSLNERFQAKILITPTYEPQTPLSNRGGLVDLQKHQHEAVHNWPNGGCTSVSSLVINYQGKVALCCDDFFARFGHGDLNETPLRTVWEDSREKRRRIYFANYELPICQTCSSGR
ncbi:MAG: radical SAM/SPASM domain-containing protein [Magnetococcales bacterium]|nr:radical SAM/SPASM domain-containing protein [Magnetococcales bacterium]